MSPPSNSKTSAAVALTYFRTLLSTAFTSEPRSFHGVGVDVNKHPLFGSLSSRPITLSQISKHRKNLTVNYLIKSCGLSPEGAVLSSKRFNIHSTERADAVLALLSRHGLSETQISKLVRSCPEVLSTYPEKTLLPKLEFFKSFGVSRKDIAKTLASNPRLLARSLENHIKPIFYFLRSMIPEKKVALVFRRSSRIFLEGHLKNVVPNMGLLREMGMSESSVSQLVSRDITALMQKRENFRELVGLIKDMGINVDKPGFVYAVVALYGRNSKLNMSRRVEVYSRWGWSEDELLSAFRKNPQCAIVSEKKIMEAMDFFVNKMGWSSGVVAQCPSVMALSLKKRIIPRCLVVKVLLLKGLLVNENLSLGPFLLPPEKDFLERYVTGYLSEVPRLMSVYQGKFGIQDA